MTMYAHIAVPVPLDQLFTYSIPPSLQSLLTSGSVVTVPFGRKVLTGIVTSVTSSPPKNISLKPVLDLVAGIPPLPQTTMKLAQWIAEYYSAPIGEVLRMFLPAGTSSISKRLISLKESEDESFLREEISGNPQKEKIIAVLRKEKEITFQQLRTKSGARHTASIVHDLFTKGLIEIRERQKRNPTAKKEWYFTVLKNEREAPLRTSSQKKLWDQLSQLPDKEYSVKEFLRTYKTSLSTLRIFQKYALLSLYQKNIERKTSFTFSDHDLTTSNLRLNSDQTAVVSVLEDAIRVGTHKTFLLHGITGSGKTQVYIEALRRVRANGKSAVVLIPEISLTPQTVKRFQIHFPESVIWIHSRMSDGERFDAWQHIHSGKYTIVIGPRSALHAPIRDLGLIIIDEEHEASYKQFDATPRYHARDVAVMRGMMENAIVLLGSATPSLESYANALSGKYTLLQLPQRADQATLPTVEIVNMIEERKKNYSDAKIKAKEVGKKAFENLSKSISALLETKIHDRLQKKEGIIILQNRRGFAPFIECAECGYTEQCDRCSVTMTYHATHKHVRCHYCGAVHGIPATCPSCSGIQLELRGFGTQRVEEELRALFPEARILRMDMDTTSRKGSHEKILRQFGDRNADILLGTQMVGKGLDFPHVTLVGVISADIQMMLPDFRSAERTFQLLTQVAGRAGRSKLAGEVIIQTAHPEHYALKHVVDHDYVNFYKEEIAFRASTHYPPLSRIILIEFKGKSETDVQTVSQLFGRELRSASFPGTVLGPAAAVISKINTNYRWHLLIKIDRERDKNGTLCRAAIKNSYKKISQKTQKEKVLITIDVDPAGTI